MTDVVDVTPEVAPAVDPPVAPAAVTPPVGTPPNYFNSDGTFNEGWQSTLPEGYRDEASLKTVNDGKVLAKMFVDTKRMVGKNTIAIPDDTSPKDEWDSYYDAGGRPLTAADFNLTRPEEMPEEYYNTELATAAQDLFHEIGLSQKQANALFAFNNNNVIAQLAKKVQSDEFAMTELKNSLSTEWGSAYEQRVHLGNVAVEQGVGDNEELKARVIKKYGNDPDLIRVFSNLGAKFVEHGTVDTSKFIPTPSDLQVQINELMASPILTDPKSLPAQ